MAPLNEIVDVQISRESVNISQVGFGTVMILGGNANFPERLRFFSTDELGAIADALLSGTDASEYKAASAICSQNPKCTQLAIGHRGAQVIATFTGTETGGTIVATINGAATPITITLTGVIATDLAALATAIKAIDGIDDATYNAGAIAIEPDDACVIGISLVLNVNHSDSLAVSYSSVETEYVTDALNAIQEFNNDWYGLILATRDEGDVEEAAAWVESTPMKIFVTASDKVEIVNTPLSGDKGSIAKLFFTKAYLKTQVRYSSKAATEYPDAATLGKVLPLDPGSYTEAFKTLSGVSVDNLTTNQRTNAFEKCVDVYEYVGGVNITRNGKVSGNEWLDVMIFIDWLDARCTSAVYQILVNSAKVPYTDAGIASVQNALTQPLKAGQNAGGISPTAYDDSKKQIGGYYVTVPRLQDVSTQDKPHRILNNVKFVAFLAGAIQKVMVRGSVTL